MECVKCTSDAIIKYGHGRKWSQRLLCTTCHSTFTSEGTRGTYSKLFVDMVVDQYCHHHITAKTIIESYHISSRTLVAWKKKHKQCCAICS